MSRRQPELVKPNCDVRWRRLVHIGLTRAVSLLSGFLRYEALGRWTHRPMIAPSRLATGLGAIPNSHLRLTEAEASQGATRSGRRSTTSRLDFLMPRARKDSAPRPKAPSRALFTLLAGLRATLGFASQRPPLFGGWVAPPAAGSCVLILRHFTTAKIPEFADRFLDVLRIFCYQNKRLIH